MVRYRTVQLLLAIQLVQLRVLYEKETEQWALSAGV